MLVSLFFRTMVVLTSRLQRPPRLWTTWFKNATTMRCFMTAPQSP